MVVISPQPPHTINGHDFFLHFEFQLGCKEPRAIIFYALKITQIFKIYISWHCDLDVSIFENNVYPS